MFIFRAVNIYPGQIDHILSGFPEVGSEFQVVLDRGKDGRDYMTIKVERRERGDPEGDALSAQRIKEAIKKQVLVSAKVEIVDYSSLPRSEKKSQRVFDNR
jgi:phenylacetate-CoA ligase